MTRIVAKLAAAFALFAPSLAVAHPGHGDVEASSALHYFAEPEHALLLAAAVGVGVAVAALLRSSRARRRPPL